MRIAVLTSVETRHRYFANAIHGALPVAAVCYETTGYAPADVRKNDLTDSERRIVEHHFAERARQEQAYFGHNADFLEDGSQIGVRRLPPGALNSGETADFLRSHHVDTLLVYGTNLLRPPILDEWSGRIVNLHLGLSPYYRGTATNFYPLLNEEPQYIGATIHLIDAGIDSGPILRHARPMIVANDAPHTIGCKAILAGIEAMLSAVRDWHEKRIQPTSQWKPPNARLYLRKDYHPLQVVELYRKLEEGMIPRYVARAPTDATIVRLIE